MLFEITFENIFISREDVILQQMDRNKLRSKSRFDLGIVIIISYLQLM